ncbi:hypothetical protein VB712_19660 [Spirulina sp. CCNP1310]|uniref:hypothetical protein n=1 Tax=Spirulina sp. CCNP1310 TaxID=3110249 RepID=UPI002B203DFE|nr:hypothetical protein [Spirulina sp. CCNP1310]MEA5421446.1 hypothetical protein [Spirulina sp. CCNP1310]
MNFTQQSKTLKPSFSISLFIILGAIYAFGTFGFLNLFGARTAFQLIYLGSIFGITLFLLNQHFSRKKAFKALLFFSLMGLGGLANAGLLTSPVESVVMLAVLLTITLLPKREILQLARILVKATFVLCSLVLVAYIYYQSNPSEFLSANFHIYDSTVGSARIIPTHFMDWISFTSGDGFMVFGEVSSRMKGYSNEPSSTIVHYLAPAVLAFLLGGRYFYLGIFILMVNIIAIASFVGHIIVILSLALLFIFLVTRKQAKFFVCICGALLIFLILSPSMMTDLFNIVSGQFGSDFDLIHRKLLVGVSGSSNLEIRQQGMITGIKLLITSPLGYSTNLLGAGSGLLYTVSAFSGWIGVAIFVLYIAYILKLVFLWLRKGRTSLSQKYGLALMVSVIFVTLFISGYGWERPAGLVMFVVFHRVVAIHYQSIEIQPHNSTTKRIFLPNPN